MVVLVGCGSAAQGADLGADIVEPVPAPSSSPASP